MSAIIGRSRSVGIGIESTWGVEAGSVTWLEYLSFEPGHAKEDIMNESSIGRIEKVSSTDVVRKYSNPSIELICKTENIGLFLKGIFGGITTTVDTPEAGVNTHDYVVNNNSQSVSYSVFYKDLNTEKVLTGAIIDTASFQFVQNDYVKVTLSLLAKSAVDTTQTPVLVADTSYTGTMTTVKLSETIAGLAGASAICMQEASIEFAKSATQEEFYCLGGLEPSNSAVKGFDVTGSFTRVKGDDINYDNFMSNTKLAISLNITDSNVTIGSSSNPLFEIELSPSLIKEYSEGTGLDDIITETFAFQGVYNVSDAKMVSAKAINTITY